MTPGTLNIPIYRGAKWEHTLTLKQRVTKTPVDLTGLGPFVLQVENSRTRETLATATITSDYDATGVMTVTIPASITKDFPLGTGAVNVGMRDAFNNPYLQATLNVWDFTPEPA